MQHPFLTAAAWIAALALQSPEIAAANRWKNVPLDSTSLPASARVGVAVFFMQGTPPRNQSMLAGGHRYRSHTELALAGVMRQRGFDPIALDLSDADFRNWNHPIPFDRVLSAGRQAGVGFIVAIHCMAFPDRTMNSLTLVETEGGGSTLLDVTPRSKDFFRLRGVVEIIAIDGKVLGRFNAVLPVAEEIRLLRREPKQDIYKILGDEEVAGEAVTTLMSALFASTIRNAK